MCSRNEFSEEIDATFLPLREKDQVLAVLVVQNLKTARNSGTLSELSSSRGILVLCIQFIVQKLRSAFEERLIERENELRNKIQQEQILRGEMLSLAQINNMNKVLNEFYFLKNIYIKTSITFVI